MYRLPYPVSSDRRNRNCKLTAGSGQDDCEEGIQHGRNDEDPGTWNRRELQLCKMPDCGKELKIFGESHIDEIAAELNIPVVGKMPIDMEYASKADSGEFAQINNEYIEKAIEVMPK